MVDRHHFPYHPFQGKATVILPGIYRNVTLLDLSMRSTLLATVAADDVESFVPGTRCTIRFRTSRGLDAFAVAATIARCSERGRIELEIHGTNRVSRRMLCQLIEASSADALLGPDRQRTLAG